MKKKNPQDIGKGLIIIVLLVVAAGVDGFSWDQQGNIQQICENSGKGNYNEKYQCDGMQYFWVGYSKDHKDAYLYDETQRRILRIQRVPSKAGEKYSSTQIWKEEKLYRTFWKKGKRAVIEIGEEKYKNCNMVAEVITKDGQKIAICYDKNGKKVDCTK